MAFRDPQRARDYQREYRRLRRAGDTRTTPCTTPVPLPFRLQTAQDIIDLIQEQVEAVRNDKRVGVTEKARTIGYLAGVALRAIEAGNLAARLEALELALRARGRKQS